MAFRNLRMEEVIRVCIEREEKRPKDSGMEPSKEKRFERMKLAKASKRVTKQQRRKKTNKKINW